MDPEEDYMTIAAAEAKISSSEAARKKELEEAHAKMKGSSTHNPRVHRKKKHNHFLSSRSRFRGRPRLLNPPLFCTLG